jgi:hypothetical protein
MTINEYVDSFKKYREFDGERPLDNFRISTNDLNDIIANIELLLKAQAEACMQAYFDNRFQPIRVLTKLILNAEVKNDK